MIRLEIAVLLAKAVKRFFVTFPIWVGVRPLSIISPGASA
jgi:hypothetical protein